MFTKYRDKYLFYFSKQELVSILIEKFRFQLVDYLTNTGIYEWVIFSGHPQEVPSFSTIGMTFDMATWALVTASLCIVTSLLFIIDIKWNNINNSYMTKMSKREQVHQGLTD